MRPTLVALAFTLAVASWPASPASAQTAKAKTARGTVTALAADTVTVKVADTEMTFTVDGKTNVVAAGAGTKERAAKETGAAGPKLADVIKVGQPVSVSYHDVGGKMHAASITAVRSVGTAAGADPAAATSSRGTVQSVSATSMTINGSSGSGAKFTQTFTIDPTTTVVGKGAGTASKGAKVPITDLIANGDTVAVSYRTVGTTLHASDVRVTAKAAK
jgi:hypothetical protein